ncbi:MAG: helix-turn-helix domain-containing protein [bacterium]
MKIIERIKQLMHESCHEPHNIEQLCERVGSSYHTICKRFRRAVGMSLSEYYQETRLQAAEELLDDPDLCIFEIANKMGFSADSNFSRWFKKHRRMTPTAYRVRLRGGTDSGQNS